MKYYQGKIVYIYANHLLKKFVNKYYNYLHFSPFI